MCQKLSLYPSLLPGRVERHGSLQGCRAQLCKLFTAQRHLAEGVSGAEGAEVHLGLYSPYVPCARLVCPGGNFF